MAERLPTASVGGPTKGDKGTAAQLWGDVFMTNEVLHDKMRKDGNEHYLNLLKMAYHWSNNEAQREHKLGKHAKKPAAKKSTTKKK